MDAANRFLPAEEALVKALMRANARTSLERLGIHVSRYGLVVTLLLIGVLKFTAGEEVHSWRGARHPAAGGEQSADVLALSNLQPSRRFQSNRSHRDRCCPAYRPAAAFHKALFHRQQRGHHHVRGDGEFSHLDTRSVPVLTRISLVRGCWPILNQGSRATRCVDLDCCRSTQSMLVHSKF